MEEYKLIFRSVVQFHVGYKPLPLLIAIKKWILILNFCHPPLVYSPLLALGLVSMQAKPNIKTTPIIFLFKVWSDISQV